MCLWCDASCEALVLHSCEISSRPGCVLQGRTPLTLAFGNGHEAMASLLVDKGADVNAKDNAVSPARRPFVQMTGGFSSAEGEGNGGREGCARQSPCAFESEHVVAVMVL